MVGASDNLDDEVEIGGFVHQLEPVIGSVGEQVLHQGERLRMAARIAGAPALSLMSAEVRWTSNRHARRCQPRCGVCAPRLSCRRRNLSSFHAASSRLTVEHRRRRARFTSRPLAVNHERHVMDGLEQEPPRQLAEPAVDRTPRREVGRQNAPAAARTDKITHRVNHLAELDLPWPASASGLGHQGLDRLPFRVGQVGRIALRLLGDLGHPAAALLGPHPELKSYLTRPRWNPFPNGLLKSNSKLILIARAVG